MQNVRFINVKLQISMWSNQWNVLKLFGNLKEFESNHEPHVFFDHLMVQISYIVLVNNSIAVEKTAIQLNLELEVGGWVAPFDLIVFGFGLLAWQKFLKQGCYIRRHRVKSLTSVWPLIGVKPLTMICCRRSVMYLSQWCTTVEIETICQSILPTIVHQPYNCTEVN